MSVTARSHGGMRAPFDEQTAICSTGGGAASVAWRGKYFPPEPGRRAHRCRPRAELRASCRVRRAACVAVTRWRPAAVVVQAAICWGRRASEHAAVRVRLLPGLSTGRPRPRRHEQLVARLVVRGQRVAAAQDVAVGELAVVGVVRGLRARQQDDAGDEPEHRGQAKRRRFMGPATELDRVMSGSFACEELGRSSNSGA